MQYAIYYTEQQMQELPITLKCIGVNLEQEPIFRPTGVDYSQWLFPEKGVGEVWIDQKRICVHPGEAVFVKADCEYSLKGLTEKWRMSTVGFSGKNCEELLETFSVRESGLYYLADPSFATKNLKKIMTVMKQFLPDQIKDQRKHNIQENTTGEEQLKNLFQEENSERMRTKIRLSKMMYDFLLDLSFLTRYISVEPSRETPSVTREIIAYLEKHYAEAITLEELAELVHLSPSYMSAVFKRDTSLTIIQYQMQLKILHARRLLIQYPTMPIKDVSMACGFETVSYFGKIFKRTMGVSPIQFRGMN